MKVDIVNPYLKPNESDFASPASTALPSGSAQTYRSWLISLLKALRPHQWTKNILVFVPVVMAHRILDRGVLISSIIAFVSFCAAASAGYVINDLTDIEHDRRHPTKYRRPIASGKVSPRAAMTVVVVLVLLAIASTSLLPWSFALLLVLYEVLTTSYSLYLKRKLVADVITLAGLYTLRVFAGGAATGIVVSRWLLAFSMFLFLSLAFIKRYSELLGRSEEALTANAKISGRGYRPSDSPMVGAMGSSSGYLAVLVVGLYVSSAEVMIQYRHPDLLWIICVVLLYWISRIWFLAGRRQLPDDPIVFAITDKSSILAGVLMAGIIWLAI
jgi:4-hydroxybenzoate polyprenyltransferase